MKTSSDGVTRERAENEESLPPSWPTESGSAVEQDTQVIQMFIQVGEIWLKIISSLPGWTLERPRSLKHMTVVWVPLPGDSELTALQGDLSIRIFKISPEDPNV